MAKLNKKQRQAKKQQQIESKKARQKLINAGFKGREVKALPPTDLERLANTNLSQIEVKSTDFALKTIKRKEQNKKASQRYRDRLKAERQQKWDLIADIMGVNPLQFGKAPTAKELDKLKLEDLQSGKYRRTDFKDYLPKEKVKKIAFDFDKVYPIPGNKKLHFAFRSLNGEVDIGVKLMEFDRYTNEELLSFLGQIANMPMTSTFESKGSKGRRTGSSGQAGEAMVKLNSQSALTELYNNEYNDNRRSNNYAKRLSKKASKKGIPFQHSGVDYYWQAIRTQDEGGRSKAYTEISPRKLLVIGNALLWSMTERDRGGFYNDFRSICTDIIPDMDKILP